MGAGWDADATKALISIWGQENVQNQLDSITRNSVIYQKIEQRLEAEGYHKSLNRSPPQIDACLKSTLWVLQKLV